MAGLNGVTLNRYITTLIISIQSADITLEKLKLQSVHTVLTKEK